MIAQELIQLSVIFDEIEWQTLEALTRPNKYVIEEYDGRIAEGVLLVTEEEAGFIANLHRMAESYAQG